MQYLAFGTPSEFEWILLIVLIVIPFWRLCSRIGQSKWLSLLALIPGAALILLWYISFAKWPSIPESSEPIIGNE
jgi:hypothetical protein